MGIDIFAHAKATPVDAVFDADGEPIDPVTREPFDFDEVTVIRQAPGFAGREAPFADGQAVRISGESCHLCMAYSAYSRWREWLATVAGYPEHKDPADTFEQYHPRSTTAFSEEGGPFWELICFSDCEGVIGATAAKKLAADFAAYMDKAASGPEWEFSNYKKMHEAMTIAAGGGVVNFG